MKAYIALIKKEARENWRTYKTPLLVAVFILFGVISPLFAKLMPEILKQLATTGVKITLPPPTALDSWAQFFKNMRQMGLLVLVILFSGTVATEFTRGTLINLLTKGLPRRTVILAKFTMTTVLWTSAYALSVAITTAYTAYYWTMPTYHHLILTFSGPWLFGLLLISLLILGGICFTTTIGSLLTCGGAVILMTLINIVPTWQASNPLTLITQNLALLTGKLAVGDFWPAALVAVGAIVISLGSSIIIFDRRAI
ncbi:ABC transporter permease [Lapidilactobacillus concavus DSM 17758]|uniref:ABC transporter permease n=1 Tax=Lapidilactobacillus concavus DSM 17758 TaxID=1423735 RepID=A0A0R1VZW3_9LACO|nr:ABC transporter permease subunit [Lapidilactobacillus concavus]KRM08713.1 ABC transporter permease [Lapidilactobacillus concavus DSM 17758]GEL14093.1 ABC transporter permease [Lapidilactobacillus concavus]